MPRSPAGDTDAPDTFVKLDVPRVRADYVAALTGNPNTGKSTVFNALTGLRQHTGNWPGKTVTRAEGGMTHEEKRYRLVDLPGTYSLLAASKDEEVARDYILFGRPDVTVIVVDATRLERNLNLVIQVLEITDKVVLCLNLMDEARRHGIAIDSDALADELGIPVVQTSARYGEGLTDLTNAIHGVATDKTPCKPKQNRLESTVRLPEAVNVLNRCIQETFPKLPNSRWVAMRLLDGDETVMAALRSGETGLLSGDEEQDDSPAERAEQVMETVRSLHWETGPDFHQALTEAIYAEAARIADEVVTRGEQEQETDWGQTLDHWLTSRWLGFPIMVLMLVIVLWLTITGANYPSAGLAWLLLDVVHPLLKSAAAAMSLPWWLDGLLIDGVYLATAWVISVMLPPMAIFFPMFTLLEDFGYLPRVALNLDRIFRRVGAHGKQALSMCMGLGCNAAGVIAARIIDSPRERLIAIITNNFSLCNGRWPTQILIATIFVGALAPAWMASLASALAVVAITLLGVFLTFVTSWGLSRTVLRGEPSTFHLELPPYRSPRFLQVLYTSLIDRTIFVLWRAVVFAIPAGALIWLVGNIHIGDETIAKHLIDFLDPFGFWLGLNGVILVAYIIAIPANEIVIPTVLMLTVLQVGLSGTGAGPGVMFELDSVPDTQSILNAGGWTLLTAVNLMLFSLLHSPCSTTIYTIWKETRSLKWTLLSTFMPVALGMCVCFVVTQCWRILS